MEKEITAAEHSELDDLFSKAHKALEIAEGFDQKTVDRLCQAVAWSVANKETFLKLVDMGVEESHLGDPLAAKVNGSRLLAAYEMLFERNQLALLKRFLKKAL